MEREKEITEKREESIRSGREGDELVSLMLAKEGGVRIKNCEMLGKKTRDLETNGDFSLRKIPFR